MLTKKLKVEDQSPVKALQPTLPLLVPEVEFKKTSSTISKSDLEALSQAVDRSFKRKIDYTPIPESLVVEGSSDKRERKSWSEEEIMRLV
jgi:hypothetical protein